MGTNTPYSTDDNITYTAVAVGEDMVTSYILAIDMTQIPIPEQLEDLTYMLPGNDVEGANTAWSFLLQLAERVSPLTEVTPSFRIDKNFDVDYSEINVLNEYFKLQENGVIFDAATNTLTLRLNWVDQTKAIDPTTANPMCIVSGLKLTPKDDAAWDDKDRLSVVNSGDVSYTIYLRANALYTFAQNLENQKIYNLYPFVNPEDESEKGGYYKSTYKEFRDNYTLINALKNGWYPENGGSAYYVEGVSLKGIQKVEGFYYDFGANGINNGQIKFTGVFEDVGGLRFVRNGIVISYGWNTFNDATYHCHSDGFAHLANVNDPTSCVKGGRITYNCANCGTKETVGDYIMPNGHEWDDNHVCKVCSTVGK